MTVQSIGITKPNTTSSSKYSQASFLAVLDSGTSIILTPKGLSSQICDGELKEASIKLAAATISLGLIEVCKWLTNFSQMSAEQK